MLYHDDHEENLLQGVVLTNSISCPNPDMSGQFTIDAYEGHSLTAELEEEFKLSSNEDQSERHLLNDLSQDNSYFDMELLTQTKKIDNFKSRGNIGKSSVKKEKQTKVLDRQCEKIVGMDTRLVEMLYSGLLDENGVISKISQLILTEQYCKLKAYEKRFVQSLKEIDFTLLEYERQKKSMINQIHLLKADNQALRNTIDELHHIIKELQLSVEQYFTSSNNKLPLAYSISRSNIGDKKDIDQSTFQQRYVHQSNDYSKVQQFLYDEKKEALQGISLDDFSQFVHQIKCRSSNLLKSSEQFVDSKLYIPIIDKFSKESMLRDWIIEIISNFHQLQKKNNMSCFTFGGSVLNPSNEQTALDRFLKMLSNNRQVFLSSTYFRILEIETSQNKQLQFWFIVHSTLITFIGIFINEPKDSLLSYPVEDRAIESSKKLISELSSLKELSCIHLSQEKEKYWHKLLSLIRMLKIRQ